VASKGYNSQLLKRRDGRSAFTVEGSAKVRIPGVVAAALCMYLQPVAGQTGGGLGGRIVGGDGTAVKGTVRVLRKADLAARPPIDTRGVGAAPKAVEWNQPNVPVFTGGLAARASAGPDGRFDTNSSLSGDYIVCIQPDDFEHLDPCKWGGATQVRATAGAKLEVGSVVVRRGVSLKVIVEDVAGFLGSEEEAARSGQLQAGHYYSNGIFEPMRLESVTRVRGGNVLQFAVAIPPDVDLRVGINGTRFTLTDERGGAVRMNAASYAVRAASGERQRVMRFQVSGRVAAGR
jgi:hypothetical protein